MEAKVPYHIRFMGAFFNLVKSENNLATGEIRKFNFVEGQRNTHRAGDRVTSMEIINGKDHGAIWVHLADDYFKMISLWVERTC